MLDCRNQKYSKVKTHKLLVVDDSKLMHELTDLVLGSMDFIDFKLKLLSAYSAKEAKKVLKANPDISLAIIDINMETSSAGLDFVNYVRNELKEKLIRLVIRTSEVNNYPALDIIMKYDINDFLDKTNAAPERIFTTVRSCIKQYEQLKELDCKYKLTYEQMTHNQVTMLPNKIKFYDDSINESHKTLILIDIVSFSSINDNNNYITGDYVLKELGAFLQAMYENEFNIYHMDSNLFALINKDDYIGDIFNKVQKINDDISKLNIVTNNFNQTLITTIGVAHNGNKNLLRKAELALKEARQNGKNQIKYYSDDLKIIKRLNDVKIWTPRLKKALINNTLIAYYQPIYDLNTNKIEKYELLVRLDHNDEICLPREFLFAAQDSGLMYDIFKYMFKIACIQANKYNKKFSVNIGDNEFKNEGILKYIKQTIKEQNTDPKLLSLEILEYSSLGKEVEIIALINEIYKLGIKIIIDDFGTECSNFAQIESLPVEIIKIDGSFIKKLPICKDSQIIVKTLKMFAKEKNIKLVAEFICSKEVLKAVKEYGIDYGQGFYIGRPSKSIEKIQKDCNDC